jgi:DNA-directed RNA polymerase subunit M/transcription elongation factor TFIIS
MPRVPFGIRIKNILLQSKDVRDHAAGRRVGILCAKAECDLQGKCKAEVVCSVGIQMLADEMFEAEYSAIIDAKRQVPGNVIADRIESGEYLWRNAIFESVAKKISESDSPDFAAVEGIYQCRKCNSSRTFSFGKQTRSSDEGTTVFVKCSACFSSWVVQG